MRRIIQQWADFLRNDEGRTGIECAVLLALITVICIGSMGVIGCASPAKK
jgi:Flp pilus assembly pilin Flp